MKLLVIFALLFAQANMLAMMAGDSKREIEELRRFIAEYGIAAMSKQAREYFEEKGVNFSSLVIPRYHSPGGDYHRMVVEEFIKKYGKDAVCPAIRSQIVANGWHNQSAIMAHFAPEPGFWEAHKIPLIIVAVVGVGLLTYEIIASYWQQPDEKKEEEQEVDK